MPRIFIAASLLLAALAVRAADAPDASLARGIASYRAGNYAAAILDLDAAANAYVAPPVMETYLSSGWHDAIEPLETTLVYLALAHHRLGRQESAREALRRLLAAERITPAYAALPLGADAAEFEALADALLPGSALPRNGHALAEDPTRPLPPVQRATESTLAERRRIAEALQPRAAENAFAELPRSESPADSQALSSVATRESLTTLRQAADAAASGDLQAARELFAGIARREGVLREVLAEAATGLYRVGAYREAADAFRRFGSFARGEEDLRYYFAVALYESGEYRAAERELACALPFIEATEDVLRYRWKIENTVAVLARK
jgi:tetratricopeptide (TPR) repeat protein